MTGMAEDGCSSDVTVFDNYSKAAKLLQGA